MASPMSLSIDDAFKDRSTPERVNKPPPTFPPSPPAIPETPHMTNGSNLSPVLSPPITTPAKTSTLRKSSSKKKPSKSSKDSRNKHSKKTLCNNPDQSDRDNGECPYSDLDSVPKILCPKALERQPKLAPSQPSVTVVKEVKKQPEIQSGLWFSKSGKERRPKTISPVPDRTLFSKVPCKKKNSPVASKKTIVPGACCSSGPPVDQSGLSDKHKPAEPALEQSGLSKCKNSPAANMVFGTNGTPTELSGSSDRQTSLVSNDTAEPSDKCSYSKGQQADAVTCTVSDRLGSSDTKKALEPSITSFHDQSRFSEDIQGVTRTDVIVNNNMCVNDGISDPAEAKESKKISALRGNANAAALEKQTSLVSKCRMPFVKLIRKDLKGKKINSSVTSGRAECKKTEKTPDIRMTKMSAKQSHCKDNNASVPVDQVASPEPIKVSVKKLKASGGAGILHLSSEPPQANSVLASSVADESGSPEVERTPRNPSLNNLTSSSQPDQSSKETSASNITSTSSEQVSSSEQTSVTSTVFNPAPLPSRQHGDSVHRDAYVPEGQPSEKSKKVVLKTKQVPDKMNKDALPEQPPHLPASSRLMTRALKAMQEAEQRKRERPRKEPEQKEPTVPNANSRDEDVVFQSSSTSSWNAEAKRGHCTKIKCLLSPCSDNDKHDQDRFSSCSTPPLRFSDSVDFEATVKSEDEDLSIASTPPMDFIPLTSKVKAKKEVSSTDRCSSSSPPSPFSFMNTFKNLEEVSFQSLTSESGGKPISFKADSNYKFSTFLMMLKDLHDTREREGTPLELEIGPPSAHVKEEPLVMPGEATTAGKEHQTERVNVGLSAEKLKIAHKANRSCQTSKRPHSRRGSSTGVRKKANRRVPNRSAKSGPGFPGLDTLPAEDSSPGVEPRAQTLSGIQTSNGKRRGECGKGVAREAEEVERWSRVKENQRNNTVPLEQRVCHTTLCLDQTNRLITDCTETNTRVMPNIGEGDQAPTGKNSPKQKDSHIVRFRLISTWISLNKDTASKSHEKWQSNNIKVVCPSMWVSRNC